MIAWQVPDWQTELARAVTDPAELLTLLDLDPALLPAAESTARAFGLRVPRAFVARMRRGDAGDPLLRQVLPIGAENDEVPGYVADPLAEVGLADDGVLHKYHGRALVVATGACAVHCRYCFRRHFPYTEHHAAADRWRSVLDRFASDPTLDEAILSGGDPLTLSDRRLESLVAGLAAIPHLKRVRVHTRTPVVLPNRVTPELVQALASTRLQLVVVLHANHAAEIDDAVRAAVGALRAAGATVLNQSVLLRGVNDDAAALAALSEALFEGGVLPYYLHQLDPVAGAAHFQVDDARALELHAELASRLPGFLVPRLVRELPGRPSKTPLRG